MRLHVIEQNLRKLTYFIRGRSMLIQHKQSGWIQTNKPGGQLILPIMNYLSHLLGLLILINAECVFAIVKQEYW